jgi:hypothetical protein
MTRRAASEEFSVLHGMEEAMSIVLVAIRAM